jgi:hypothetical protein
MMGTMRDIRVSTEVAAIVGEEDLARLRTSPAFGRYTCWACGRTGSPDTEATTVVVELHELAARVALAHARCTPSQLVQVSGAPAPGLADEGGADMAVKAAILPYRPQQQAVLIVEPATEFAIRSPGGERVNVVVAGLLGLGLSLVTSAGEVPPPAPGWQLDLLDRSQLRLTAADRSVVFEGSCGQPRPWRQEITPHWYLCRGADWHGRPVRPPRPR